MVLGNCQCLGVLLILMIVGQGLTALAVGVARVAWTFFLSFYYFSSSLPLFFWKMARCRLNKQNKDKSSLWASFLWSFRCFVAYAVAES